MSNRLAFCIAEDRVDAEAGVRLAILSLVTHCPGAAVYLYRPEFDSGFKAWIKQFPRVTWISHAPVGANSWNCKPHALKPLLERHCEVVWLDSDIIVTRDCRPLFENLDEGVLVVAQEPASLPYQGTAIRTRAWNLEVQRSLPFTLNSAVVRVTSRHLPLLDRWTDFLANPRYVSFQSRPLAERPIHMAGDQDILNALIGAPAFADVPLHVLRSAVDIIHAGGGLGYSWRERFRAVFNPMPTFLHATAGKPWLWLNGAPQWSQRDFFSWHRRLLQETSPYLFEARRYRNQLGQESAWMDKHTVSGLLLRLIGLGHFALRGLPLTVVASGMQAFKILLRSFKKTPGPALSEDGVPIFDRWP